MKINIIEPVDSDRPALVRLLSRVQEFDDVDIAIALELLGVYLSNSTQKDYIFRVAITEQNLMAGFICYGPTPLTEGTYDLYWIAVDPAYAGQGIGTQLIEQMEYDLIAHHVRLVIIETSSARKYILTRQFYLKNGYFLAEVIPDFYRWGEDRVTFAKFLSSDIIDEPRFGKIEYALLGK